MRKVNFISFVDSDDYIAADMIDTLHTRLNKTGSDMCVCGIQYVDEMGVSVTDRRQHNFMFKDQILTKDII